MRQPLAPMLYFSVRRAGVLHAPCVYREKRGAKPVVSARYGMAMLCRRKPERCPDAGAILPHACARVCSVQCEGRTRRCVHSSKAAGQRVPAAYARVVGRSSRAPAAHEGQRRFEGGAAAKHAHAAPIIPHQNQPAPRRVHRLSSSK
jgi:hypothetical protein